MFSASNGKQRFPTLADALRRLGVPVTIVADFDVLRDSTMLAKIVEAQGGQWSALEKHWRILNAAVSQRATGRTVGEVGAALVALIEKESTGERFSRKHGEAWREELKPDGPWDLAKRIGVSVVRGEATVAARALLDALRAIDIFVIESCELESFDRTVGGKSARWVNDVLAQNLLNAPELETARAFVSALFPLDDGRATATRANRAYLARLNKRRPRDLGRVRRSRRLSAKESRRRLPKPTHVRVRDSRDSQSRRSVLLLPGQR